MDYDISKLELKENDIVLVTIKTDNYGGLMIPSAEAYTICKSIQNASSPNRVVVVPDTINVEAMPVRTIELIRDELSAFIDGYNKTKLA